MDGRFGERPDNLEHLDHRAGPAVGDDERQGVFVGGLDVDEVDIEPVDLGPELWQSVQLGLAGAPVVGGAPVCRQSLDRGQLHTLRPVDDQLLGRPAHGRKASSQRLQFRLGDINRKRPDCGSAV